MTDEAAPISKPIHAQFRDARALFSRVGVFSLSTNNLLPEKTQSTSTPFSSFTTPPLLPLFASSNIAAVATPYNSFWPKSYAQVATWVLPRAVIPMSCELKLKEGADETDDRIDDEGAVPKRKRASPLTVRASESQKEILRQKAKAVGMSVGGYMLASSLGSDYKPPVDKERTQALLALFRESRAQGNNLNQIAKLGNSGKITEAEGESMLAIMGRSYLHTNRAIMKALAQGKEPQP